MVTPTTAHDELDELRCRLGLRFARDLRRGDAEQSCGPGGKPPVPASEEGDGGWGEDAADDGGVDQDAAAEGGGEHLRLGSWRCAEGDEGEEHDQRRARDEPTGSADSLDDGGFGGAGAVVGL